RRQRPAGAGRVHPRAVPAGGTADGAPGAAGAGAARALAVEEALQGVAQAAATPLPGGAVLPRLRGADLVRGRPRFDGEPARAGLRASWGGPPPRRRAGGDRPGGTPADGPAPPPVAVGPARPRGLAAPAPGVPGGGAPDRAPPRVQRGRHGHGTSR